MREELSQQVNELVDHIKTRIASLREADFIENGRPVPRDVVLLIKLDVGELAGRLVSIIGKPAADAFFKSIEPSSMESESHLSLALARLLPSCCSFESAGGIELDIHRITALFLGIVNCTRSGRISYFIRLRVTNLTIERDVELAPGVRFHRMDPAEIERNYRMDHPYQTVPPFVKEHWRKHNVEVIITKTGTPAEYQDQNRLDGLEAAANSIIDTFLLSGLVFQSVPNVTHIKTDSPIDSSCLLLAIGGFSFEPSVLTQSDFDILRQTYALLHGHSNDCVLQTAIERFLLGRRRSDRHPSRMNEANWDKIVDYVIAMETLFLTVNGEAPVQELAYRFRLNGSSLLCRATEIEVHAAFDSLKHLYDLRCTIVHGGNAGKLRKTVDKLIQRLNGLADGNQGAFAKLAFVTKKVEEWMRDLFFYFHDLPLADRPYRKQNGWEDLLWQESGEHKNETR